MKIKLSDIIIKNISNNDKNSKIKISFKDNVNLEAIKRVGNPNYEPRLKSVVLRSKGIILHRKYYYKIGQNDKEYVKVGSDELHIYNELQKMFYDNNGNLNKKIINDLKNDATSRHYYIDLEFEFNDNGKIVNKKLTLSGHSIFRMLERGIRLDGKNTILDTKSIFDNNKAKDLLGFSEQATVKLLSSAIVYLSQLFAHSYQRMLEKNWHNTFEMLIYDSNLNKFAFKRKSIDDDFVMQTYLYEKTLSVESYNIDDVKFFFFVNQANFNIFDTNYKQGLDNLNQLFIQYKKQNRLLNVDEIKNRAIVFNLLN